MAAVLKRSFLGIEIGTDAISAVLYQIRRGSERIVAAHRVLRTSGKEEAEALSEALEPILALQQATVVSCAVALPAGEFVFRHLSAPFSEDRKLRQVLPFELEPSLAVPAEKLIFDYRRLTTDTPPRILAAALEKKRLADLLALLGGLRLDPEWITVVGACPALRLTDERCASGQFVVAALRPNGVTMVPTADGRLLSIRDFPAPLESDRQTVLAMWRQTLQAVAAPNGGAFRPEGILLTGYGPYSGRFEAFLAEQSAVPVERIDLRHAYGPAPSMAEGVQDWDAGAMNGALALALSARRADPGFNLRQGDFAVKKFWTRHRRRLKHTAILAAVVFVLAVAQLAHGVYLTQRRTEQMTQQILALFRAARPETSRIVDPVNQMRASIAELEAATRMPGSQGARPRAVDILAALSREIPATVDVEMTRLVIGPENLTIMGDTDTFNAVDEIKTRLEKNPLFQEVTIAAANIDKQSNRVRFTLNIGRLKEVPWPSN